MYITFRLSLYTEFGPYQGSQDNALVDLDFVVFDQLLHYNWAFL